MSGQTSFPVNSAKIEGIVNANPSLKTDPVATLALGKVSPVDGHTTGMAAQGMHILGSLWHAVNKIYRAPQDFSNSLIDATVPTLKGAGQVASVAANSVTSGLTFGLVGPHGFNRTQNMQQLEQDTSGLRNVVAHPTEVWNQTAHFGAAFATSIHQNGWAKTLGQFAPAVALAALTDGAVTGFTVGESASSIAADVQTVARMQRMVDEGKISSAVRLPDGVKPTIEQLNIANSDLARYQAALARVQRFVDKTARAEEAKATFQGRYENMRDSVKQWSDLTHKAKIGQTLGQGWKAIGKAGALGNNVSMATAYQLMSALASQDPQFQRIWEQTKDLHVYDEYNRKIGTLGQSVAYALGMAHSGLWTGALSGAIDLKTHYMSSDPFQLYGDLAKASRSESGIGGLMGKWWQGLGVETGADVWRTWNESHQSINAYKFIASHNATEIGKRFPEMFTDSVRVSLGATKSVEEAVQVMADVADAYHLTKNVQPTMGMITYMKTLIRDGLTLGDAIGEDPAFALEYAAYCKKALNIDIAPKSNAEVLMDREGRKGVVYLRHLAGLWDSLPRHTELTPEGTPMIESRSFVAGDKRAIPGILATLRFSGRLNERIIRNIGDALELTDNPTDYMTALTQGVRHLYEQAIAKAVPNAQDTLVAETLNRGLDFEIRKLFGFSMGGNPEKVYINGVDGAVVSILRNPLGLEKGSGAFGIGTTHLARFAYPDFREVNNLLDQITTSIMENRPLFEGHVTQLADLQEKSLEQLIRYRQTAAEKNELLAKAYEENKALYGSKAKKPTFYEVSGKVSLDGVVEGVSKNLSQRLREIREGRTVDYNIEPTEADKEWTREKRNLAGSGANAETGYKIAHDELRNMIDTVKSNPYLTDVQKYFEVARRLSWERKTLNMEITRILDENAAVAWRQQGLDSAVSSAQGAFAAVHDFETAIYSPLQEANVPISQMRSWALKEARVGTETLAERRALEKLVFDNFKKPDGYMAKKIAQPGKDMLTMGNNTVDLANKVMAKTFVAMCLSTGGYIMRITGAEVALNAFRIGPRKFANVRLMSSLPQRMKRYEKPSVAPNDPKEFIGEHGKNPETLMHGSPHQIDNFYGGKNGGVYFTTQKDVAERFADKMFAGKSWEEIEDIVGRSKLDAASSPFKPGEDNASSLGGVIHTAKIYGKKLDFNPNLNFKAKRLDTAEWWNGLPDFAKEFLAVEAKSEDPEMIARWIQGGYGWSYSPHNWHESEKFKDFLDKAAGFGYGKIALKDHADSGGSSILAHPDYIDHGRGTPREIAARDGTSEIGLIASQTKNIMNNIVQTVEGIEPSRLFKDPSEVKLKDALGDFASRMHDRFQGAFLGIEKGFFEAMSDDEMWVMMDNISLGLIRHGGGAAPEMGHGSVTAQFNPDAHSATVEKVLGIRQKVGGGGWEPTEPVPTKRGEDYVDVYHKPEYLATAHVENLSRHHFDTMMHPVMVDLQKELERAGNYAFRTKDQKYELINRLMEKAYQRLSHMDPKELEQFKNSKWLINSADPYYGTTGNPMMDHAKRLAMDAVGSVEGADGLNRIVLHKSLVDQAVSGDIDTEVEMAHRLAHMGIEAPRHIIAKEFQDYGSILGPLKSLASLDFFQELNRMGIDKVFRPMIQYASRTPVWAYGFHVAMEEQRFLIEKGLRTEDEAALIADYRATWNMSQFVHNPADKLRFEQNLRIYSPFYFAQNQAYRRAARLLTKDPGAFMRYMKVSLGVTHWAATNNVPGMTGMFALPGSQIPFNAIAKVIADVYSIVSPQPVDTSLYADQNVGLNMDTTSVKTVWPTGGEEGIGMVGEFFRPAAGPYVDIALKSIGSFLNGGAKEVYNKFLEAVLGPIGSKTGISTSLAPSSFLRSAAVLGNEIFNLMFNDGKDALAMTSAHMDAYNAMWNTKRTQLVKEFFTHQAVKYSFPATYPGQTTDQALMQACNTWVDERMVHWMSTPEGKNEQVVSQGVAIGNYSAKVITAFNAPASVALNKFFSKAPEFKKIMETKINGEPIGVVEAMRRFGEQFPHSMGDLVARYSHPRGSLPTNTEFLKWWKADSELVKQNSEFLSYFISPGGDYQPDAFQIQHLGGFLVKKDMQEYVDAFRARLGQDWWTNKKVPEIYARTGSTYYGPNNPNNKLTTPGATQMRQAAKVYGATANTPWFDNSSYGVKGRAIEVRAIQQMNNIATNPEVQQRMLKTKLITKEDLSKLIFLNNEYKRMETAINTQVAEGRSGGSGRSDMWNTMQAYANEPALAKFKDFITSALSSAPTAGG